MRAHAGRTAAFSEFLAAWFQPLEGGKRLGISDDKTGEKRWLTLEQQERAAKEAERVAKEGERAAKETALRRIAELEAEKRGSR